MFVEIIKHTPIWVWLLLAFLIQRGISNSQEKEVNILKSFPVPGIFILWGLYNIFTSFTYYYYALLVYVLFLCVGVYLGYKLYHKNHRFFVKNGVVFRSENYLPLVVILVNFLIKYALNIYMNIDSEAIHSLGFNILYTCISGTTVGLFFGGILNTYRYTTKVMGK